MGGRYTTGHCVSGQFMCSHPQYLYLILHQIFFFYPETLYFVFYSHLSKVTILLLWFVRNLSEHRLELKLWNCWEWNFDLNTFGYRYWDAEQPDNYNNADCAEIGDSYCDLKGNPSHLDLCCVKKHNYFVE